MSIILLAEKLHLPGEQPSGWAQLVPEPDKYFDLQWGWSECWATQALHGATADHLTDFPEKQEAAHQRMNSHLKTETWLLQQALGQSFIWRGWIWFLTEMDGFLWCRQECAVRKKQNKNKNMLLPVFIYQARRMESNDVEKGFK